MIDFDPMIDFSFAAPAFDSVVALHLVSHSPHSNLSGKVRV